MRTIIMEYKGYIIHIEKTYYRVTSLTDPDDSWTEDTIQDAKHTIDKEKI